MKKALNPLLITLCLLIGISCSQKKTEEPATEEEVSAAEETPSAEADQSQAAETEQKATPSADASAPAAASGESSNSYVDEEGNTVYNMAEVQPTFVGGEKEMTKWLEKNLNYPKDAKEEGTVYVEFVVGENGKIRSSKVIRGPEDPALRAEALKEVNAMPAWTPGQKGGKAVNTKFILPITFRKI